ncbi:IS3 family transposase [Arthrobacter sp. lap29]|uniref:IS3 family transposase n=1 Tax=Arthrobacter sp. lap29 TaxID=3056122 RepID=UPI0037C14AE6
MKNEFYHHYSFDTRQEAMRATMRYIEVFYNRWRPHMCQMSASCRNGFYLLQRIDNPK